MCSSQGELSLEEATAARALASSPQADTDPTNTTNLQIKVTGKNGTDLAAIGDRVAGTTVVEAPLWCSPVNGEEWGETGPARRPTVPLHPAPFLAAGEQETLEFGLRIDQVIPKPRA